MNDSLDFVRREHLDSGILAERLENRLGPFTELELEEHSGGRPVTATLEIDQGVCRHLLHLVDVRLLVVLVSVDRLCQELIHSVTSRTSCGFVIGFRCDSSGSVEAEFLLGADSTDDLEHTVLLDLVLGLPNVLFADACRALPFGEIPCNPDEIDRLGVQVEDGFVLLVPIKDETGGTSSE